jgi:hypothetical protein
MTKKALFFSIKIIATLLLFPWWDWMFTNGYLPTFQGNYFFAGLLTSVITGVVIWGMVKNVQPQEPDLHGRFVPWADRLRFPSLALPSYSCSMYVKVEAGSDLPHGIGSHYFNWTPARELEDNFEANFEGIISDSTGVHYKIYKNDYRYFRFYDIGLNSEVKALTPNFEYAGNLDDHG